MRLKTRAAFSELFGSGFRQLIKTLRAVFGVKSPACSLPDGHRGRKEVTLTIIATQPTKCLKLIDSFNTLGDHLHFQRVGKIDSCRNDMPYTAAIVHFVDKGAINLDHGCRQSVQVGQR